MRRPHGNRSRICGLLVAALGTLAMLALPAVGAAKDRNHDRIPDRWEKRHHLSLHVNQAHRDQDGDHLRNHGEFLADDNPRNADTDGDGVMDGEENAGKIESFDPATGRLVIDLFGGDTVSGTVTDQTRIQCGHECHHGDDEGDDSTASASSHHGDDDTSGPGNPGEDNSGPGNGSDQGRGPGEDPPGHDGTPPGASEDPGRGADHTANCTTDALVVGAVVDEAELELEHGVATFEKVELAD